MSRIQLTVRLEPDGRRYNYLKQLKKYLEEETQRPVFFQEVFEHLIDMLEEESNLPLDSD